MGSILRIGFALSTWPHLHRAYLVSVCNGTFIAVCILTSYGHTRFRKLFTLVLSAVFHFSFTKEWNKLLILFVTLIWLSVVLYLVIFLTFLNYVDINCCYWLILPEFLNSKSSYLRLSKAIIIISKCRKFKFFLFWDFPTAKIQLLLSESTHVIRIFKNPQVTSESSFESLASRLHFTMGFFSTSDFWNFSQRIWISHLFYIFIGSCAWKVFICTIMDRSHSNGFTLSNDWPL